MNPRALFLFAALTLVACTDAGAGTPDAGAAPDAGGSPDAGPSPLTVIEDVEQAVDLTADGRTLLLQSLLTTTGDVYFYDTVTGVLEKKTESGSFDSPVFAISSDGRRVVGVVGAPFEAALWSEAEGWKKLGNAFETGCDPQVSGAWDVSADGSVLVGLAWDGCRTQAVRWSDASGTGAFEKLQRLGVASGSERATVVSANGKIAAGFAQREMVDRSPALWRADGSGILLDPSGENVAEVLSLTADGATAGGIWNQEGFLWSEATGVVTIGRLPDVMPNEPTHVNAVAAGGTLAFGASGDSWTGTQRAFVWTADAGMKPLAEVVTAAGVAIPEGLVLANVRTSSTDGTVIAGQAVDTTQPVGPSFKQVSFVLRLPVSAYGLE